MAIKVTKLHSFTGHRDAVYTLQGTDQPNLFCTGAGDGMVVLWDLEKPDEGYPVARLPNSIYRSEEHTSELQSRENLVCRLLLEKKTNSTKLLKKSTIGH